MGEGTVSAMTVEPGSIALKTLTGAIDGRLDLGIDGGVLTFDDSGVVDGGATPVRVLSASSVAGAARLWRAVGSSGRVYRCSAGVDGLYCHAPRGIVLLFR